MTLPEAIREEGAMTLDDMILELPEDRRERVRARAAEMIATEKAIADGKIDIFAPGRKGGIAPVRGQSGSCP